MSWKDKVRSTDLDERTCESLIYALEKFSQRDFHLIDYGASERSISHRIALYLEDCYGDFFNVDCEYNKNRTLPKYIPNKKAKKGESSTFPDIIVHERGLNTRNHLVIEIKKIDCGSVEERQWDIAKLNAYKHSDGVYGYENAVFLEVGKKDGNLDINIEVISSP
jgi:hypothetical protein